MLNWRAVLFPSLSLSLSFFLSLREKQLMFNLTFSDRISRFATPDAIYPFLNV
jgi:hypothetical protein